MVGREALRHEGRTAWLRRTNLERRDVNVMNNAKF